MGWCQRDMRAGGLESDKFSTLPPCRNPWPCILYVYSILWKCPKHLESRSQHHGNCKSVALWYKSYPDKLGKRLVHSSGGKFTKRRVSQIEVIWMHYISCLSFKFWMAEGGGRPRLPFLWSKTLTIMKMILLCIWYEAYVVTPPQMWSLVNQAFDSVD